MASVVLAPTLLHYTLYRFTVSGTIDHLIEHLEEVSRKVLPYFLERLPHDPDMEAYLQKVLFVAYE